MVHRLARLCTLAAALLALYAPSAGAADPNALWSAYPIDRPARAEHTVPTSARARPQTPPTARAPSREAIRQAGGSVRQSLPGIVSLASAGVVLAVALSWIAGQARARLRPQTSPAAPGSPDAAAARHTAEVAHAAAAARAAAAAAAAAGSATGPLPWVADLHADAASPRAREDWAADVYDDAYARETERMAALRRRIGAGVGNATTEEQR